MHTTGGCGAAWRRLLVLAICGAMLVSTGCYELVYRRFDKQTVRRQFHLPRSAFFLEFKSYPETPGWFGREGLQVTATVAFPGESFDEYVERLDDPEVWKPVRYLSYSPSGASEHSEDAFKWHDLPVPESIVERFQLDDRMPEVSEVTRGKHYGNVIMGVRGEPNENTDGGYYWRNVGRTLVELTEDEWPTILAFGVLDYEEKLLHVRISFSG